MLVETTVPNNPNPKMQTFKDAALNFTAGVAQSDFSFLFPGKDRKNYPIPVALACAGTVWFPIAITKVACEAYGAPVNFDGNIGINVVASVLTILGADIAATLTLGLTRKSDDQVMATADKSSAAFRWGRVGPKVTALALSSAITLTGLPGALDRQVDKVLIPLFAPVVPVVPPPPANGCGRDDGVQTAVRNLEQKTGLKITCTPQ